MLWVLKRTVSMRWFFEHPKHVKTDTQVVILRTFFHSHTHDSFLKSVALLIVFFIECET